MNKQEAQFNKHITLEVTKAIAEQLGHQPALVDYAPDHLDKPSIQPHMMGHRLFIPHQDNWYTSIWIALWPNTPRATISWARQERSILEFVQVEEYGFDFDDPRFIETIVKQYHAYVKNGPPDIDD